MIQQPVRGGPETNAKELDSPLQNSNDGVLDRGGIRNAVRVRRSRLKKLACFDISNLVLEFSLRSGENLREGDHLEYRGVDWRVILRCVLEK